MTSESKIGAQAQNFVSRVEKRDVLIAVVGLGYVGLPLALSFNRKGFDVIGFDVDEAKIVALDNCESYLGHIPETRIKKLVETKRFRATTDFSRIGQADAVLLCVPTPLGKHHEPDLTYVEMTARQIAPYLRQGQLVVLESTTYPGTTMEVMVPILEEVSGLRTDKDFFVAYSPEREDPGNPLFETSTIPKVVGADNSDALQMAGALYGAMVTRVVEVSSLATAEAVKLTENIFRAVNIAMVNELKIIYDDMGIDVWEVINAAASKPFGFMPFYPGPGLGGHCIPIDPFYLTWKAREFGHHTRFIELAGEINRAMPKFVISKLAEALSRKQQKSLNGARILVAGIAYKKNVDDMRESPALFLMEMLEQLGARVEFHDPHIREIPMTREHAGLAKRKSVPWSQEQLGCYDAVLVATDHKAIDWRMLARHGRLIIDTRNVMSDYHQEFRDKIVKA